MRAKTLFVLVPINAKRHTRATTTVEPRATPHSDSQTAWRRDDWLHKPGVSRSVLRQITVPAVATNSIVETRHAGNRDQRLPDDPPATWRARQSRSLVPSTGSGHLRLDNGGTFHQPEMRRLATNGHSRSATDSETPSASRDRWLMETVQQTRLGRRPMVLQPPPVVAWMPSLATPLPA